ncbi:MAG TPA: ATP-binding protein, partial [Candidatus Hodarchaeales archaeon]|nr:ATP-binding protein [Candidatus Hodarchaeales archaeon]
ADRETLTRGRRFYSIAKLNCVKMIDRSTKKILEFETVPGHFSPTRFANLDDIKLVYKDGEHSRSVGTLRGLPEFPIPIDLQTLTSVPFGIFGRTHSGKTFLNKILLGNILHSQVSQVFVFDTQSEYGWRSRADNSPGLKTFFSSKVKLLALDKQTTPQADEAFVIDRSELRPQDLLIAFHDLTENMQDALFRVYNHRAGYDLVAAVENTTEETFPDGTAHEIHSSVLQGLKNRMERLKRFKFIDATKKTNMLARTIEYIKNGYSIVLDFGQYGTDLSSYLVIANLVVRRLYETYSVSDTPNELPRLVVLLEEAHKFLEPSISRYTIFDRLAREMRKFGLVLAMVDQRPSSIDDEILSQLANRFILSLTDPKDIEAALTGPVDPHKWRSIVSAMPPRTALVFGDAIPVPTAIEVEHYEEGAMRKKWETGIDPVEIAKKISGYSADQIKKVFDG